MRYIYDTLNKSTIHVSVANKIPIFTDRYNNIKTLQKIQLAL